LPAPAPRFIFAGMDNTARTAAEVPRLPPAFDLVEAQGEDAFDLACRLAPARGAGTFVLGRRGGVLGLAVVLEPEEPLAQARLAFLLGMVALGDALAAHAPPERMVRLVWPGEVHFDRARLGGGRLAVAPGTAEDAVPEWLVFGAELLEARPGLEEPGRYPDSTSLTEEGFDPAERLVETFASYVMLHADRWRHDGPAAVTNRYLMRIDPPLLRGVRRIEGDRLVEITPSGRRRHPSLAEALAAAPAWRGPEGPAW
jgi:hypothetical protein